MFLCFMLCARSRLGSFVLGVMLHKPIGHLLIYISKPFVVCAQSTSYFNREKENKNITKKVINSPNQSTLLTLLVINTGLYSFRAFSNVIILYLSLYSISQVESADKGLILESCYVSVFQMV